MSVHDIDEAALTALVQTLVRRPSEQTERFEAEPAVTSFIADLIAPLLVDWGFAPRLDGMGNLVLEIEGTAPGPSLALVGYAMTHPAGSMRDAFAGERVEGLDGPAVRGRGIAEQKAPLSAALLAVRAAARRALRGRLALLVLTAGETGRHDAIAAALRELGYTPDHAVVLIGTGGAVSLGNKGRIDVEITVHGEPCHSSQPWRGVDAIAGARRILDGLDTLSLGPAHPHLGAATLVATRIASGPPATHTLQDRVEMTLDRRLLPGDDADAALDAIAAAAEIGAPWRVDVRRGPFMHPCALSAQSLLLAAIETGCRWMDLPPPRQYWSHGALDAGYLQQCGSEALMWGPGDPSLWHRPDECVAVRALVDGARAYQGLVSSLLGTHT